MLYRDLLPAGAPTPPMRQSLNAVFASWLERFDYFDHVRLISLDGIEMARVNNRSGEPLSVGLTSLQDKGDEPYVRDALKLMPGKVDLTRISLNRENGIVEQPFFPVLRFRVVLADESGESKALLVANLSVNRILADAEPCVRRHRAF